MGTLKGHIQAVHEKIRKYQCEICLKKFGHANDFKRHMNIHTGTKFECEICGKKFSDKGYLKKHLKKDHSLETTIKYIGENPFKCELCKKSFSTEKGLEYHKEFTHNTKPENC